MHVCAALRLWHLRTTVLHAKIEKSREKKEGGGGEKKMKARLGF